MRLIGTKYVSRASGFYVLIHAKHSDWSCLLSDSCIEQRLVLNRLPFRLCFHPHLGKMKSVDSMLTPFAGASANAIDYMCISQGKLGITIGLGKQAIMHNS